MPLKVAMKPNGSQKELKRKTDLNPVLVPTGFLTGSKTVNFFVWQTIQETFVKPCLALR